VESSYAEGSLPPPLQLINIIKELPSNTAYEIGDVKIK
jgi:hypothetical protein